MYRCKQLLIAVAFTLIAISAAPAAASEQGDVILAQQTAPAPALQDWAANIKLEHIIAVGAGALVGDMVHGAVGLSGGAAIVIGGVLGYYVYINYFEKGDGPAARRINAVTEDAKLYLTSARDMFYDLSHEYLGAR